MKKLSLDYIRAIEAAEAQHPERHPYAILLHLAMGEDVNGEKFGPGEGPSLTLRAECAQYLLRTRLPVLSRAEHQAEVTTNNKPAAIPRQAVLEALRGCKSAGDLQAVLEGRKTLLLDQGENNDAE